MRSKVADGDNSPITIDNGVSPVARRPRLDRVDRRPRKLPAGAHVRVAREQVAHIHSLNRQANQLEAELLELLKAHRPKQLAELGCGAADGDDPDRPHADGVKRFRKHSSFGLHAWIAPIQAPLGVANRTGFPAAGSASSTARCTSSRSPAPERGPATKQYLAREQAEGKTTNGALRCLSEIRSNQRVTAGRAAGLTGRQSSG